MDVRKGFAGFGMAAVFALLSLNFGMEGVPAHHTVYLVSPANNSYTSHSNNTLAFIYNHTGTLAGIVNCTLYLDGAAVNYTENVTANQNINVKSNTTISEGQRWWWVNCTNGTASESSLDIGWNFTVNVNRTIK